MNQTLKQVAKHLLYKRYETRYICRILGITERTFYRNEIHKVDITDEEIIKQIAELLMKLYEVEKNKW